MISYSTKNRPSQIYALEQPFFVIVPEILSAFVYEENTYHRCSAHTDIILQIKSFVYSVWVSAIW